MKSSLQRRPRQRTFPISECKFLQPTRPIFKMHNSLGQFLYVILIAFVFYSQPVSCRQRIVEHPQNTTVRIGETVILKCRVENQKGSLQWVKGGFGLGTARDMPLLERFSMVGKINLGEYHLQIKNVTVTDEDMYECQLSPTDNETSQVSSQAKLTVLVEPEEPRLLGDYIHPIEAIEGVETHLACRSPKGRPAARLGWVIAADREAKRVINYISNDSVSAPAVTTGHHHHRVREHIPQQYVGKITETIELDEENGVSIVTSNLTFAPTKAENGRFIACLVAHETYGKDSKSASVEFDVSYRPKIRVDVDEAESSRQEGGRLVFRCRIDAKPMEDVIVRWSWSGEEKRLAITDSHTAMLSGLKIKDNGARVTCTASNAIGTESSSIKLDIPYGPRFMSTNQTKLVERGESVSFQCEVVGNPAPEVRWFRRDRDDHIAMGNNYTISNAQDWEAGEYRCVATVNGFTERSLTHNLYLKGPPIVFINEELIEGSNGIVTLSCDIQTRTYPVKVLWLQSGRAVDVDREKSRFTVHNLNKDGGIESRLTIQQFSQADYGLYNCTAQNEYGASSDEYDVLQHSIWDKIKQYSESLPLTYRLAILIIAVCLLVCALMVCYDHGDVIVKCEALDGGQFYPDILYGSPHMDPGGMDYMSVPQSNPDLDYLPPNAANFGVIAYGPPSYSTQQLIQPGEYYPSDNIQYNNPYGSFNPGNQGGVGDMYAGGYPSNNNRQYSQSEYGMPRPQTGGGGLGISPLETLTEVVTPESDGSGGTPLLNAQDRPVSRVSTHV
ncbi:immunoglobulin domain-containing protein [Ditylenchus destructor]|nr:immunoglobulin domain-containing protein [Ditylenchus destructor]